MQVVKFITEYSYVFFLSNYLPSSDIRVNLSFVVGWVNKEELMKLSSMIN